jgi:hypothetical protein
MDLEVARNAGNQSGQRFSQCLNWAPPEYLLVSVWNTYGAKNAKSM